MNTAFFHETEATTMAYEKNPKNKESRMIYLGYGAERSYADDCVCWHCEGVRGVALALGAQRMRARDAMALIAVGETARALIAAKQAAIAMHAVRVYRDWAKTQCPCPGVSNSTRRDINWLASSDGTGGILEHLTCLQTPTHKEQS